MISEIFYFIFSVWLDDQRNITFTFSVNKMNKKYLSNDEASSHFIHSKSIQIDYLLIIWVVYLYIV